MLDVPRLISRSQAKSTGSTMYFTGRACKRGHVDWRWVANRTCLSCENESNRTNANRHQGIMRWRESNKEQISAYGRRMRAAEGRPARRAKLQRWRRANPGKVSMHINRRRARARSAPGKYTAEDIDKLLKASDRCHVCGKRFSKRRPPTLDHVIPLAHELATNDPGNLALAHQSCNSRKNAARIYLI
jgi:5-methylcytosine-specific restriction endonuclease McrA